MHPGVLPPGYEFRRLLGTGATGWVALARQTALNRDVAVKTVLTGDAAGGAIRRLEREGRVLAGLDDPGIVRAHQLVPARSAVFLVMEFLPGHSLQSAADGRSCSPDDMLTILGEIARVLSIVHSRGIAHRDIKPANVMLHPQRGAVLVDFGLARLPPARASFRTNVGTPTGTPLYMAPEQITRPGTDDPSIDHYAFGVLAYHLLLGSYPYPISTVAGILESHRAGRPIDPRDFCKRLPAAAARGLLQALDKDPTRRLAPADLVRRLRSVPVDVWPRLDRAEGGAGRRTGNDAASATADDDGDESTANSSSDRPGSSVVPGSSVRDGSHPTAGAAAITGSDPAWIGSSIYRPRGRSHRRLLMLVVACTVGVLAGLAVAALLVR